MRERKAKHLFLSESKTSLWGWSMFRRLNLKFSSQGCGSVSSLAVRHSWKQNQPVCLWCGPRLLQLNAGDQVQLLFCLACQFLQSVREKTLKLKKWILKTFLSFLQLLWGSNLGNGIDPCLINFEKRMAPVSLAFQVLKKLDSGVLFFRSHFWGSASCCWLSRSWVLNYFWKFWQLQKIAR